MKRILQFCLCLIPAFLAAEASALGNKTVTVSGGYAFGDIEDTETNAEGWRATLLFDMSKPGSRLVQGLGVGFADVASTATPEDTQLAGDSEYGISTLPIYWAPKVLFGENRFKAFVAGALGMQISWLSRSGAVGELSDTNGGFYGGANAGALFQLNEVWSVNAEYQWAYMSNSYYRDGFLNSVTLGIGMRR